jgi:hypothetical protein
MAPSRLADPIATPLDQAALAELLASEARPCLSVYMPTHRRHPENQQDPIRCRHLLRELAASLRHAMPNEAAKPLLEPFEALAEDRGFWNHTLDGLAVMGAPRLFRVFLMQRPTAELGSDELTEVARAAVAGRVATLLIEAGRELPGRVAIDTGRIDPAELDNPRVDDVLDDLGALVEKMGGEVHVLSGERMPGSTGVAATFRH